MVRAARELDRLGRPPDQRVERVLEGMTTMARGVHERAVDVP
jgi:hypothetical protein